MKRWALVLCVVAACGGKSKPAREPVANDPAPENAAPVDEPDPAEPDVVPGYERAPACGTMLAMYSHIAQCPKVPQQTRDALNQALQTMRDSWGDISKMDATTVKATDDSCKQALDGVRQAMTSLGC